MKKLYLILFLAFASILCGCEFFTDHKNAVSVSAVYLDAESRGIGVEVSFYSGRLPAAAGDILEAGVVAAKGEIENPGKISKEDSDYVLSSDYDNPAFYAIENLDAEDYNVTFTFRAYYVYTDKSGAEKTVYSDNFLQAVPYELAKGDDSEFALEIVAIVEGVEDEDEYVPVRVTFDLNGGRWTDGIAAYVIKNGEPEANLTVTSLNDKTAKEYTLLNKQSMFYQYYYKLFIKEAGGANTYRVVAVDAATRDIIRCGVDDYDFVLAVHDLCEDGEAYAVIKDLATSGFVGAVVVFDEDIRFFTGGQLTSSFYPVRHDENLEMEFKDKETLPPAEKEGFHFGGWSDGENVHTVFPGYQRKQNVTAVTYAAVWELYSVEEFRVFMSALLPDVIDGDLELPLSYSGYAVSWKSSHPEILSDDGKYAQPFDETVVTLTATLSAPGVSEEVNFHMRAKAYKTLEGPIASSYIYRDYNRVDDAFFETLDIINCAFLTAASDGHIYGSNTLNNIMTYIMPGAREHGCWVIFSIAPESQWHQMAADPAARVKFAENIVEIINEYGFDGVDIDWEGSVNGTNFTYLMEEVYAKVKANNPRHLVTAAIAAGPYQPPYYNLKNSGKYIDYINMMAYGLVSSYGQYQNNLYPRSGYHNPDHKAGATHNKCSIQESVDLFKGYGIPASKIIIGAAFYGIKQIKQGDEWKSAGSVYYTSIASSYLNNPDYTVYFDTVAGVPYILKNDGTEFISYDDPRSIQLKCDYIYQEGLAGMMYWENGCDLTGTLLAAMRKGLNK
ncbi:MAG: glycosyl hydrolase family 18 protein [Bacillota bacterium]|nr:glycosyl hydrolase family 18 protein [Bacillota bacterium]